jgi:general secretion pathway protein C
MVFWALKFVSGTAAPANAAVVTTQANTAIDSAALSRGLGGGMPLAIAPVASNINASRFVLTGLVAGKTASQGIALLAVDGKPARPYRVGAEVASGVMVQAVQSRLVRLSSAPDANDGLTLELPALISIVAGSAVPVVVPQIAQPVQAVPPPAPPIVIPPPAAGASPSAPTPEQSNPAAGTVQNAVRAGAKRLRAGPDGGPLVPETPASVAPGQPFQGQPAATATQ